MLEIEPNRPTRDTYMSRNLPLRHRFFQLPYLGDLFLCDFLVMQSRVFGPSLELQMRDVDTRLVLAGVMRDESLWNRSMCTLPEHSMSGSVFPAVSDQTVPIIIERTKPNMASSSRINPKHLERLEFMMARKIAARLTFPITTVRVIARDEIRRLAAAALTQTKGNDIVGVRHLESPSARRLRRHGTGALTRLRSYFVPKLYHSGGVHVS